MSINEDVANVNMTIEQNPSRFSLYVNLYQTLYTCYCSLTLNIITSSGKNYQNFFDKTYDMCSFLNKRDSEFFMLFVHDELSRSGLWMDKCPIQKVSFFVECRRSEV